MAAAPLRDLARRWTTTVANKAWVWAGVNGAVTPGHPLARQFGALGPGSRVAFPPGDRLNPHAVHIGSGCFVGAGVTLSVGMPTEVYPPSCAPVIEVGDRGVIGKDCWLVARERLVLEDDVTLAPNVYITDHNHTYTDPWLPVGRQVLQSAPVRIGAGSWLATNVVVLPGADIGRNCTIAAGTVVRGTVPDHSVVAGVPGKVIRRWTETGGWDPPVPSPVEVPEGWPVGRPPS